MLCPFCSHKETKVTNKRDAENLTRRRRECLKCRKRFTTYEKTEAPEIFVVKKDGRREPYNRDKLLLGIVKACEKRALPHDRIEKAVNEIEEDIRKKGKEVKSMMIGELVMKALKKMDKVAYIRFASVYRDFKDVNDFRNITKEIKKTMCHHTF
ncbi:transcriptional repressor NrdR [Candidatus Pacearchaeota archaeon]|nr:transcriptional repressor NrdR [Candidatus Pacearchaeota archaeon]